MRGGGGWNEVRVLVEEHVGDWVGGGMEVENSCIFV